jgi:hypothetical protein
MGGEVVDLSRQVCAAHVPLSQGKKELGPTHVTDFPFIQLPNDSHGIKNMPDTFCS